MLSQFLEQTINGVVTGNIYALMAVGLALIFGAAGVVNFAHGSVFMTGAYVGWLFITRLHLPFALSVLGTAAACAILGMLMERIVVRKVLGSSELAPLLATLGLSFILDQTCQLVFGPHPQAFSSPLPARHFIVGGATVSLLDCVIFAVTLLCATGLWALLRYSKVGWAIRAVAQDRDAARQMGVSVEAVSQATFAVASALGGLAGLLVGIYFNNITPTMGFAALLKGLVAQLLGGMASMPGAIVGGLALGVIESWGVALLGSSFRDLFAYAILIAVLLLRPQGLLGGAKERPAEPMTGTLVNQSHPVRVPLPLTLALIAAGAVLPLLVRSPYVLQVLVNAWLFGLLSLSLTLVSGTLGQISMGHAGLMAIGGYASALFALQLHLPVVVSVPLAALVAACLGTLLVAPTFRLRSHYLAIATLGIGEIVRLVILNWDGLTRGAMGLPNIPPLSVAGRMIVEPRSLYWASFALLVIVALLQATLVRSSVGRAFKAIRDDERAAASHGIGLNRYKALAFAASAFVAGIAGAFTAHMYSYINSETFGNTTSILGLTMAILGGLGNIWGAVAGSVLLIGLPELFRGFADFRFLVYGLALVLLVRFRPGGLFGID